MTGGGRGIGRSIALAYAAEGADVAVVARTSAEVEEAAAAIRALGRTGAALTADLTDAAQIARMTSQAVETLGGIDILVNNAGGYRLHTNAQSRNVPVLDYEIDEWRRIMDVNCTAALLVCQAVVPLMIEQGRGVVVNVTSGAANLGRPGWGAYGASKAALNRVSEALAAEIAEPGVAAQPARPRPRLHPSQRRLDRRPPHAPPRRHRGNRRLSGVADPRVNDGAARQRPRV